MSLLDMDAILAQTAKAVAEMNQSVTPGEATREFYREQGRQQERQRMTETEAIRENYNLGVLAGEAREQQRIIKLLEVKLSQEMSESAGYIMTENNYPVRWADLIALIKGENK